jgi:GNAT superfamily N-acetyltransferase
MTVSRTEVAIRSARPSDAPALSVLLGELGYPASARTIEERLRALLDAGEVILVATLQDEPVALVTTHVTPVLHRPTAVGRLTALVVSERVRGQGVGRVLVEAAERTLAERGCELIEVTSNQSRTDAHAFFERLGYDPSSLRFRKTIEPTR